MSVDLTIVAILALVFGVFFFITEYFEHILFELHASYIAGISVVYFFIIVLPEIAANLPEFPFHLEIFEYLFVLIGFIFVHITEKFILQKVEGKTQKKMRKLIQKEKILKSVEHNMEKILTSELKEENLDDLALKDITRALTGLNVIEETMKTNINRYKIKIQNHVNKELKKFRFFTDYTYHFLVGIIIVGLLREELISGILFFFYAFFRTVMSKRSESHLIFTDLDIYEETEYKLEGRIKYILTTSALTGIIVGLIINMVLPRNLELLFIFYSFISGVILYVIVREVIPEKEKGDPIKFLIGLISFAIIILVINLFMNVI